MLAATTASTSDGPGRDEVADGGVERQHRARERDPVRERHAVALDEHPSEPIEPLVAAVPARAMASLTSSEPIARLEARDEGPERRVDVVAVRDQLGPGRVVEERRDRETRLRDVRRPTSR